jgi:hypothetical protein
MMLEFEGFQACGAFELAKIRTVRVIRHMPLQLGQVGKLLGANGAWQVRIFWMHFLSMTFEDFQTGKDNATIASHLSLAHPRNFGRASPRGRSISVSGLVGLTHIVAHRQVTR